MAVTATWQVGSGGFINLTNTSTGYAHHYEINWGDGTAGWMTGTTVIRHPGYPVSYSGSVYIYRYLSSVGSYSEMAAFNIPLSPATNPIVVAAYHFVPGLFDPGGHSFDITKPLTVVIDTPDASGAYVGTTSWYTFTGAPLSYTFPANFFALGKTTLNIRVSVGGFPYGENTVATDIYGYGPPISSFSHKPDAPGVEFINDTIYLFDTTHTTYPSNTYAYPTSWIWSANDGGSSGTLTRKYGVPGITDPDDVPCIRSKGAAWSDGVYGWLFGGYGLFEGHGGYLNDLWKWDSSSLSWTKILGITKVNTKGIYGTLGVGASTNRPGARREAMTWVDPNTNDLYMYGGYGYGKSGAVGYLSDFWR